MILTRLQKKTPFSTACMHNRLKSRCFGEHQSIKVDVLASDTKSRLFSMLESKTTLFFHSSIASVKNDPFIVKLRWAHNSSRIFEPKMTKSLFYRVSRATLEYKGAISKPPRKPAMFILPLFYRWKFDLSEFFPELPDLPPYYRGSIVKAEKTRGCAFQPP